MGEMMEMGMVDEVSDMVLDVCTASGTSNLQNDLRGNTYSIDCKGVPTSHHTCNYLNLIIILKE